MNVYNQFLEKLHHKNRINSILNEDINDKLLSKKERKTSLNLLLSTRPELKENINKIKLKYGYSQNIIEQQNLHHQISQLKNKYIKNNSDKYKINNVNKISYINNEQKEKYNESFHNNNKIKGHSVDLGRNKTNSFFYNNNNNEKDKISFGLSSEQLINNINNNSTINENHNKDEKIENEYHNYIKNTRNDFYLIDKKVNEILENEKLSPEKNQRFNSIYPISNRIHMLNNIKKEIKLVNKNIENSLNNSSISQVSGSNTTIGFKYITPKFKRVSIYNDIFGNNNNNNDTKNLGYNENSKENDLEKPVLIKWKSKPRLNVMHFSSFCKITE